jgi:hypothetical protein
MTSDQRRFQVFVSSTFLDLLEHRQAVTAALLECEAFPSGMELFPAAEDDAWTLIKKVIDECDYYLLVIGGKYGSIDPEENLSYTEMEFNYAVAQKKPVMAFLHGDPDSMPVTSAEVDSDKRARLQAFRESVKSSKHVKYWTSAEGLAGQVALSFNKFTRLYPSPGWIRADRATSVESMTALADARDEIEKLKRELETLRSSAPSGTEALSQGDDTFELPTLISFGYIGSDGEPATAVEWARINPSWNEILGAVGPQLLNEMEQEQLREAIQEWITISKNPDVQKVLGKILRQDGIEWNKDETFVLHKVKVDNEDLGTILVQLKATGLIKRSDRKRSVNDNGTYWTLTPYGENETIKLRAIKRNSDDSPAVLASSHHSEVSSVGVGS